MDICKNLYNLDHINYNEFLACMGTTHNEFNYKNDKMNKSDYALNESENLVHNIINKPIFIFSESKELDSDLKYNNYIFIQKIIENNTNINYKISTAKTTLEKDMTIFEIQKINEFNDTYVIRNIKLNKYIAFDTKLKKTYLIDSNKNKTNSFINIVINKKNGKYFYKIKHKEYELIIKENNVYIDKNTSDNKIYITEVSNNFNKLLDEKVITLYKSYNDKLKTIEQLIKNYNYTKYMITYLEGLINFVKDSQLEAYNKLNALVLNNSIQDMTPNKLAKIKDSAVKQLTNNEIEKINNLINRYNEEVNKILVNINDSLEDFNVIKETINTATEKNVDKIEIYREKIYSYNNTLNIKDVNIEKLNDLEDYKTKQLSITKNNKKISEFNNFNKIKDKTAKIILLTLISLIITIQFISIITTTSKNK